MLLDISPIESVHIFERVSPGISQITEHPTPKSMALAPPTAIRLSRAASGMDSRGCREKRLLRNRLDSSPTLAEHGNSTAVSETVVQLELTNPIPMVPRQFRGDPGRKLEESHLNGLLHNRARSRASGRQPRLYFEDKDCSGVYLVLPMKNSSYNLPSPISLPISFNAKNGINTKNMMIPTTSIPFKLPPPIAMLTALSCHIAVSVSSRMLKLVSRWRSCAGMLTVSLEAKGCDGRIEYQ